MVDDIHEAIRETNAMQAHFEALARPNTLQKTRRNATADEHEITCGHCCMSTAP